MKQLICYVIRYSSIAIQTYKWLSMFLKFLCEFIEFFFTDVNYFHRMCFAIFSSFFKVFFISIVCVSIPHNSTISKSRYVFVGLKMNICNNLLSVNTHGFQQRRFSMTFYTSIQLWHMIPSHLNFLTDEAAA